MLIATACVVGLAWSSRPTQAQSESVPSEKSIEKFNLYKPETDIQIGKLLSAELEKEAKIVAEPQINEHINRLIQSTLNGSDSTFPFTVKVLDTSSMDAYAFPGGFIYLSQKLIQSIQSEAALSGLLAHLAAHINDRHFTRTQTSLTVMNLAYHTQKILLKTKSHPLPASKLDLRPIQEFALAQHASLLEQKHERSADYSALQYMYRAGYTHSEIQEAFSELLRLQVQGEQGSATAHLPTPGRLLDILKRADTEAPRARLDTISRTDPNTEFQKVRATLDQ